MEKDIRTLEFWMEQWRQSLVGDTGSISKTYTNAVFWDSMSKEYDREFSGKERRKLDDLAALLEREGLFAGGMNVLDIGCGTGRLALTLAARGAHVTALDISGGMLERLRQNSIESPDGQIETVHAAWDDIDLNGRGWNGGFDLVIASMSPAIHDPATFLKMTAASRGGCYYKAWAEMETSQIYSTVWHRVSGKKMNDRYAPIFYIINYLFARSCFPHLFFEEINRERTSTTEQVIQSTLACFSGFVGASGEEIEHTIIETVRDLARDGLVIEHLRGKTASILWKV